MRREDAPGGCHRPVDRLSPSASARDRCVIEDLTHATLTLDGLQSRLKSAWVRLVLERDIDEDYVFFHACKSMKLIVSSFRTPFPYATIQNWVEAGGKKAARRIATDYLDWALSDFSGYIAADELYDGPFCVLSIVDNRTFKRLAYQVLDHDPTHRDIEAFFRRFQQALEARGLEPPWDHDRRLVAVPRADRRGLRRRAASDLRVPRPPASWPRPSCPPWPRCARTWPTRAPSCRGAAPPRRPPSVPPAARSGSSGRCANFVVNSVIRWGRGRFLEVPPSAVSHRVAVDLRRTATWHTRYEMRMETSMPEVENETAERLRRAAGRDADSVTCLVTTRGLTFRSSRNMSIRIRWNPDHGRIGIAVRSV